MLPSGVMGLDLSLTGAGITVLSMDGKVLSQRSVGYGLKKDASGRDQVERMIEIVRAIVDDLKVVGESPLVGIERMAVPFSAGKNTKMNAQMGSQMNLAELRGVVRVQLWLGHHIEPEFVVASSARKEVFGRGNLIKDQIEVLLRSKGFKFCNQDAMDAYVIAECVRRRHMKGGLHV